MVSNFGSSSIRFAFTWFWYLLFGIHQFQAASTSAQRSAFIQIDHIMVLQNEYKRAASARHRGRGRGQGQPAPHSPAAHRLVKNEFPDLVSASASASSQPSSSPATDPGGDDDTEHSFKFSRRELRDNANRYDEPAQQLEDGPAVEGDGGWESKVIVEQTGEHISGY